MTQFFGKYRGKVTDNRDPLQIGRVRALVPDVLGDLETGWAMPCFPFAGSGMGGFGLPKVDAGVWIEFEQGNPDFPIWSGCFFGNLSELPSELLVPPLIQDQRVIFKTAGGTKLVLDDAPGLGGITLETATGQKIKLTATGIEIDNGLGAKISLTGPQVSVNNGALDIL
jgi:uncharacterized protein involved in type VI secretion and phage assembly